MGHVKNRRRHRLVDRPLQVGLAWRMMIAFMLFFAGGVFIVFAPSMAALSSGRNFSELDPAAREFLILHKRVWPAALFTCIGVFLYTLVLSNRIAGPIYRINTVLRRMLEGEFPDRVTLRRGDFFTNTADLLEKLSNKTAKSRARGHGEGTDPRDSG